MTVTPEEARWEAWDRDRFIKFVQKFPKSVRIGVSHDNERMYSVLRVWESRSIHLTFEDRPGEPHSVFISKVRRNNNESVEWISGGLRAWIDALEISRDELLEAIL